MLDVKGRAAIGGPDVIMWRLSNWSVREAYLCQFWKLGEEAEITAVVVSWGNGWAGGRIEGTDALNVYASSRIHQLTSFHIHKETEVAEDISANDGLVDVCNYENPLEGTA